MSENIPELIKGYVCPSLDDCSKCQYKKTDCIIFSRKGQKIAKEYQTLIRKNKELIK